MEAVHYYWHFVDVVWVILFFTLYVLKSEALAVMNWRAALVLGAFFVTVGIVYLLVQGSGIWADRSGATMLIVLGIAMAFGFTVLIRGSREL